MARAASRSAIQAGNSSASEATRERIIRAAADCIADVGLAGVRMTMVAHAAGVSNALLHYHFDTRENLFSTVMRRSMQRLGMADLDEAGLQRLPPPERLCRMLISCLPSSPELRHDWLLWHELWSHALRDPELGKLAVELYAEMDEWLAGAIRDGIASGDFASDVGPLVTARAALALCDGFGLRVIMRDPAVPLEVAVTEVLEGVGRRVGATLALEG